MIRTIQVSGAYNIRDLGGLPCVGGGQTRRGVFVRGDSPHALNHHQQQALCTYGVNTVIDLRSPRECAAHPNPFAQHATVRYAHVPLQATGLRAYDVRQIADISLYYLALLRSSPQQFAEIFRMLVAAPSSVYIHCRIGKDRTGMVAAMILDAVGVAHDTIIEDYTQTTANITPLIAAYQSERPFFIRRRWYEGLFDAKAVYMQRFLAELQAQYGGAAGYFSTIGIPEMPNLLKVKLRI